MRTVVGLVVAGKLEDTLKRLRRNSPTRKHHNDGKLHIPSNRLVHTLERRNVIGNNNHFFLYFFFFGKRPGKNTKFNYKNQNE
jgi:hypothetical protein